LVGLHLKWRDVVPFGYILDGAIRQLDILAALLLICLPCFAKQISQPASVPELFKQLQSEHTTDEALQRFLELGPNNIQARKYLEQRLPSMISQEPKDHPRSWLNEVRLAGEFRITQATPALSKWIGLPVGTLTGGTIAEAAGLDFFPAGKALVKIGEPAVPSLTKILATGSLREKWVAYRALYLIASPQSLNALRAQLKNETDAGLKREIKKALDEMSHKSGPTIGCLQREKVVPEVDGFPWP
jgi:hypothetical protein